MNKTEIEAVARGVLRIEKEGIGLLEKSLPMDFSRAVSAAQQNQGKIVVSGIGKSGHIGKKIAATLASTGTPAIFVHPVEASHGDLGMVSNEDFCLMISNSGETKELEDLVFYAKNNEIPLAAITSNPQSFLARSADFNLGLPEAEEACAIGLAPTTSTTLALALGDAFAVALMKFRGFGPKDFKAFHPGGKLGISLSIIDSFMHSGDALPLVEPQTLMEDALLVMSAKGFGVVGLLNQNKLVGVISDGDLRRNMKGLLARTASDVASNNPVVVQSGMLASEALQIMSSMQVTVLFVVKETGTVEGIVHIHDLIRAGLVPRELS